MTRYLHNPYIASAVVVALVLLACVIAFPGRRAVPLRWWRLVLPPPLVAVATLLVLRMPPFNDLLDPQVWMFGLPSCLVGIGRGAWIRLRVDHGQGKVLLRRAPEEFWIAVAALLLLLIDLAEEPVGLLGSDYTQSVELMLVVLSSFLVGRNATLLVRSRDTPQSDL